MFENKNQNNTDEQLNNIEEQLAEIELLRQSVDEHKKSLKSFWKSFLITGFIMIAAMIALLFGAMAWFVSNSQVRGTSAMISAAGKQDFALATVGTKEQGVYDSEFGLSSYLTLENIGGTDYYIASGNSSFRVSSDKNLNNYLANADLRPGNRGSFDLYVICRTDNRNLVLNPVFSAWYEYEDELKQKEFQDAFAENADVKIKAAAEFLKGHILLFANIDEKGMYSGFIDLTKEITVDLSNLKATQSVVPEGSSEVKSFLWGKLVYSDNNTAVYRLPIYWVWPEQFGNLIYTGNSYNKNLFASKSSPDYQSIVYAMQNESEKFFCIDIEEENSPPKINIASITDPDPNPDGYITATKNYELYSEWYNAADEQIGTLISYIELGFEIVQGRS